MIKIEGGEFGIPDSLAFYSHDIEDRRIAGTILRVIGLEVVEINAKHEQVEQQIADKQGIKNIFAQKKQTEPAMGLTQKREGQYSVGTRDWEGIKYEATSVFGDLVDIVKQSKRSATISENEVGVIINFLERKYVESEELSEEKDASSLGAYLDELDFAIGKIDEVFYTQPDITPEPDDTTPPEAS